MSLNNNIPIFIDVINVFYVALIDLIIHPIYFGFFLSVIFKYVEVVKFEKLKALTACALCSFSENVLGTIMLSYTVSSVEMNMREGTFLHQNIEVDWKDFFAFIFVAYLSFQAGSRTIEKIR